MLPRLALMLLSQAPAVESAVEHPASLAYGYEVLNFIQAGGGWALFIIVSAALVLVARQYKAARDSEISLLRAWNEDSKKLIEKTAAACAQQASTNDAVAAALDRLAQSVQNCEDSHGP